MVSLACGSTLPERWKTSSMSKTNLKLRLRNGMALDLELLVKDNEVCENPVSSSQSD
jgi:hypothetical protein